jgi:uncharacterized protein YndB with AHSA1/START domain
MSVFTEQTYNAPVAAVWKALTDQKEMKVWYFDMSDFKPAIGFAFTFSGQGKDGESYLHHCTVTEVEKEKKLQYSWRYDGYEGISFVTFELFPDGNTTSVKLTHEGLETFPVTANNAFAKENFVAGWNHLLGISLKEFVEKAN